MIPVDADAWLLPATLGVTAVVYTRGWRVLSRRMPRRFGVGRLAAFIGGITVIASALSAPLHALAEEHLSAHMVQHQLLMMLAPPLLWFGAPVAPTLRGLPRGIRRLAATALTTPPVRLIVTAKLNDVDPQAWLADVLNRIGDHPASHLDQLLPWNWRGPTSMTSSFQPRTERARIRTIWSWWRAQLSLPARGR